MALQPSGHVASSPCALAPCCTFLCPRTTRQGPSKSAGRGIAGQTEPQILLDYGGNRRAQKLVAAASDNSSSSKSSSQKSTETAESILGESDSIFFLKLLVISFAGAAAVKYGSLLLDTPFHPNLAVGLSIIAAPCIAFAVYMSSRSR